ncbi:MAG: hypothetical protein ACI4JS_05770 [Oscillospiraceae bacterium]
MKSYEEVTHDLLKRRDEYETMKTIRQHNAFCVAMPVCAAALVMVMGVGIALSGFFAKMPIAVGSDNFYDSIPTEAEDKIVINKSADVGYTALDIGLNVEDFVSMTFDEMLQYYGADIRPDVPENLSLINPEFQYGVYKRDGGEGEIYWDNTMLYYSNEDYSRILNLEVAKGRIPPTCCIVESDDMKKSTISGVEVLLLEGKKGLLYAEFMFDGVGFRIDANGLTGDEFVEIVRSIILKNQISVEIE